MNQASPVDVQALRDRIRTLLDEELPEAHLAPLWPSIETEWLGLFPETQELLNHLRHHTDGLKATDKALETLLTVCDRHLGNLGEAAGYRAEADKLKKVAADLFKKYDERLKK